MPLNRRRQRSVRVTLAVALLAVATVLVLTAFLVGGVLWLGAAALVAWGAGVCASRIISNELAESRRENSRDRAEAAQAYNELAEERAAEHERFTATMRQKVEDHSTTITRLKANLRLAEKRAELAEQTADRNKVAVTKAHKEIAELKSRIAELEGEAATSGTAREPAESIFDLDSLQGLVDVPSVVELRQRDERAQEEPVEEFDEESGGESGGMALEGQRKQA